MRRSMRKLTSIPLNPKVYFFTASWCGPCLQAIPIFSEVISDLDLSAQIIDVDIDPEVADQYEVDDLPTVLVTAENTVTGRIIGARSKPELRRLLSDIVASESQQYD